MDPIAELFIYVYHYLYTQHVAPFPPTPATDEQNFRDGAHLYKFLSDDGHEGGGVKDRRVSALPSRLDFRSTNLLSCISLMVRGEGGGGGRGGRGCG